MPKQTNKYPGVKTLAKGLQEIIVEAGYKSDGRRDRVTRWFHGTPKEGAEYREQLKAEIRDGKFLKPAKMLVGEYLYWWLDHVNDDREEPLSDETIKSYRARIKNHLIPAMGGIPLDKLNVMHIQKYRHDARENGQRPRRKKIEYQGTVNATGQEVHWLSGDRFSKILAGRPVEIGDGTYIIASYDSSTRLTLVQSVGIQKKVSYRIDLAEFKPFTERTINYSLIVLRMALDDAVKPYKLIKENPANEIEISAKTKKKKYVITPEQMGQVFDHLSTTDRRISVYALFTGVRRGEACGTLWSKLNLDTAAVKVDRAIRRVTGEGIKPKPPKTERSNRPIDLPAAIVPMLKQTKLEQAKNKLALGPDYQDNHQGVINVSGPIVTWVSGDHFTPYLTDKEIKINGQVYHIASVDSETSLMLDHPAGVQYEVPYRIDDLDLVFCQYNGKPLDPDGVSKHFKKAARAAGFPEMRFHDLRHNFASWALADGEKLHVVQELLGHEKASTTENIYGEAMPGSHKAAMDRFGEKYGDLIKKK